MPNLGFSRTSQYKNVPVLPDVESNTEKIGLPEGEDVVEYGANSGRTAQVTITDRATIIVYPDSCRRAIKVTNLGTVDVWIGFDTSVSTFGGDLLVGVKGASITIPTRLSVYAIVAASASQTVSFMEVGD